LLPDLVFLVSVVPHSVPKEQILAKMQELDALLQAVVNVRTELWSMIADIDEYGIVFGTDAMAGRADIEGSAGAVLHRSRDSGEETRMEKTNLLTVCRDAPLCLRGY